MRKQLITPVKFEVGDSAFYARENADVFVQSILIDVGSKSTEVSYLCVDARRSGDKPGAKRTFYLDGDDLYKSKREYFDMKSLFSPHPL